MSGEHLQVPFSASQYSPVGCPTQEGVFPQVQASMVVLHVWPFKHGTSPEEHAKNTKIFHILETQKVIYY